MGRPNGGVGSVDTNSFDGELPQLGVRRPQGGRWSDTEPAASMARGVRRTARTARSANGQGPVEVGLTISPWNHHHRPCLAWQLGSKYAA